MLQSTLWAAIGVQKSENRRRDFTEGNWIHFVCMGIGFTAYIAVGLSDHTKDSQLAFEKAITQSKEVIECHNITGSVEYLLRVETADLAAYKVFHTDVLGTLAQVNSISTYVVMDSPKDTRA